MSAFDAEPGGRLLYVATIAPTISHFLAPYARVLRSRGWRVVAAANGAPLDSVLEREFDAAYDLPLTRSILDPPGMLAGYRALSGLLHRERPDIVHVHTPIAAVVARLAVRRMPLPGRPAVIYTAHGFHFHRHGRLLTNFVFRTVERVMGRWTDRLIVINAEDEGAARRDKIVPARSLVRMPGIGLDVDFYDPSRTSAETVAAAMAGLGMPMDVPLFVAIGELNSNKRQGDAIEALAAMRHRDARLAILGEGPLRDALEATASRLGVRERVRFADHVADVRPILVAATALVHPSRREGLSRAVMESLAMGTPVIASTARGNAELVENNGRIVEIGDVPALAEALDELARDAGLARRLGATARARIVERYAIGGIIERHLAMYEGILARRAQSGAPPATGSTVPARPRARRGVDGSDSS